MADRARAGKDQEAEYLLCMLRVYQSLNGQRHRMGYDHMGRERMRGDPEIIRWKNESYWQTLIEHVGEVAQEIHAARRILNIPGNQMADLRTALELIRDEAHMALDWADKEREANAVEQYLRDKRKR